MLQSYHSFSNLAPVLKKKTWLFIFLLLFLPCQAKAMEKPAIGSKMSQLIKATTIISAFYGLGALLKHASKILSEEILEPTSTYPEQKPNISFKASSLVVQETATSRLEDWLKEAQMDQEVIESYLKAFRAGLQLPLILDVLQAGADVYQDIGKPIVLLVKELFLSVMEGVQFSYRGLTNGFSGQGNLAHEYAMGYPLVSTHATALDCGKQDLYCRMQRSRHQVPSYDSGIHPQELVLNFSRLVVGIGIELTGIGLGSLCALAAYLLTNMVTQNSKQISLHLAYIDAFELTLIVKIITAYLIDNLLLELARSLIVHTAELYLPKQDNAGTKILPDSKDLKEAIALGEKAKKIALKGLTKELTPIAHMVARLVYGRP